MDYKIIEESPVARKVEITVSPEEVGAAIAGEIELTRKSVQLDGFRKGKVPANVVEKRFHDTIYEQAKENLINVNINEVLQNLNLDPIGPLHIKNDKGQLEKGKEYVYTLDFEVLPEFELPKYEGLEVEEVKTVQDDKELQEVFDRLLDDNSELAPVEGKSPAVDGQIALIDFQAYEDDKPVEDLKASNFELELGKNRALPDFETIVKGLPVGNTGEGVVNFPEDFFVESLAGKTLKMKVTVHAVKQKIKPELNDEFAKKIGFPSAEALRDLITKSYLHSLNRMNRGVAERKLLDMLLKQVDFPLPPEMVKMSTDLLLGERGERLERQGKSLKSVNKSWKELVDEMQPEAENFTRERILLLSIAKKENLAISPEEVHQEVMANAIRKGEDFEENLRKLEQSGMIFQVRDQMLCDKAMDLVYSKASVKMLDPSQTENDAAADSDEVTEKPADAAG